MQFAETDESPLMAAAKRSDKIQCLRALIDAGADVNLKTRVRSRGNGFGLESAMITVLCVPHQGVDHEMPGYTALMFAARGANFHAVKALIGAGAVIDWASPVRVVC